MIMKKIMMFAFAAILALGVSAQCPQKKCEGKCPQKTECKKDCKDKKDCKKDCKKQCDKKKKDCCKK